jgi:hypothetical protein
MAGARGIKNAINARQQSQKKKAWGRLTKRVGGRERKKENGDYNYWTKKNKNQDEGEGTKYTKKIGVGTFVTISKNNETIHWPHLITDTNCRGGRAVKCNHNE